MATKWYWYVWVVECGDDYGWGACYDGLWGYEPRTYATRSEADAHRDACRDAGCWTNDDGAEQIPEFYVRRRPVITAVLDSRIEDEVRDYMPPAGTRIPAHVLRAAATEYGVAAQEHSNTSAALAGASSATHTHALLSGWAEGEGRRLLSLIGVAVVS